MRTSSRIGGRTARQLSVSSVGSPVSSPILLWRTLSPEELERIANLGNNGPRDVEGKVMTHCVPNERVVIAADEQPVEA